MVLIFFSNCFKNVFFPLVQENKPKRLIIEDQHFKFKIKSFKIEPKPTPALKLTHFFLKSTCTSKSQGFLKANESTALSWEDHDKVLVWQLLLPPPPPIHSAVKRNQCEKVHAGHHDNTAWQHSCSARHHTHGHSTPCPASTLCVLPTTFNWH